MLYFRFISHGSRLTDFAEYIVGIIELNFLFTFFMVIL
jgi:hypothetical protein